MTGTNCDLFTHKSSRSYLNHLVNIFFSFRLQAKTLHKTSYPSLLYPTLALTISYTYLLSTIRMDLTILWDYAFRIRHRCCCCRCFGNPWFPFPTGKMEDFLAPRLDVSVLVLFMQMRQKRGSGTTGRPITGVNKTCSHDGSAILILTLYYKFKVIKSNYTYIPVHSIVHWEMKKLRNINSVLLSKEPPDSFSCHGINLR
jgi:hypothetical protein